MSTIYLDNAATAKLRKVALDAMLPFLGDKYLNPSSSYAASTKYELDGLRASFAGQLQVKPNEIIFTAGATEANNIIINGIMRSNPGASMLLSAVEHESVLDTAKNYPHDLIGLDASGQLDLRMLSKQVTDRTSLISVMLVNNETGLIMPVAKIAKLISEIRRDRQERGVDRPLLLHSDAAQAGYLKLLPASLGVDTLTLNGSKLGGPKQSGGFYLARSVKIKPYLFGGGQERGLRPGTEAMHQIAGFVAALKSSQKNLDLQNERLYGLRDFFELGLQNLGANIVGKELDRSPHITCALFPGTDNERMSAKLAERGVYVGVGSACHAAKGVPSHVLVAHNINEGDAKTALRFSYSTETTKKELNNVLKTIQELL